MRLSLRKESGEALSRLHQRCKSINPNAEGSYGPFIERFLVVLENTLTKEQWEAIAEQLTSETVRRRRKKALLVALSEKADLSDIENFAKKVAKKQSCEHTASIENPQKPAETCVNS